MNKKSPPWCFWTVAITPNPRRLRRPDPGPFVVITRGIRGSGALRLLVSLKERLAEAASPPACALTANTLIADALRVSTGSGGRWLSGGSPDYRGCVAGPRRVDVAPAATQSDGKTVRLLFSHATDTAPKCNSNNHRVASVWLGPI